MNGRRGSERPQMVLKPKIIAGIIPRFLAVLVPLGIVIAVGSSFLFLLGPWLIPVAILVVVVAIFLSYMNLRSREYRFYSDRAEFFEGFLNINQNVVRYERVTDITYNRSVWERLWGTGSILLNTAGTHRKELRIGYIENPEEVYGRVQDLVRGSGGYSGTEAYRRGSGGNRRPPSGGQYSGTRRRRR